MTKFHVPYVPEHPDGPEALHATLAAGATCPTPAPDRRIESMTFMHDGVEWTATVGQQLRGVKTVKRRRQGRTVEVKEPQSDRANVVAIFAGAPYRVWLDAPPLGINRTAWMNPFMATNDPTRVIYFGAS